MYRGTIVYIGGFEYPDKNAASLRSLGIAKILRDLEYNVVLIGVDKRLEWGQDLNHTLVQGFEVWSMPYPKKIGELASFTTSTKYFKEVISKYNNIKMVICYDYQAFAFDRISRYCRKANIKIVADATEWYSSKGMGMIRGLAKKIDVFYRMRILQKKLDGLIVVSRYLYNYYINSLDCVIIPPLVDLNEKKWNFVMDKNNSETINLIYAGNPGIVKDKLNKIIKIIVSLPISILVHIDIIGVELGNYLQLHPEDMELLEKHTDRVTFLGRLSHEECIQNIINADYYIFWRDNNIVTRAGFPSKLVESLSCGTPVITTRTSNIDDYLTDGVNGWFLDFDELRTSKKMNDVLLMGKDKAIVMKNYCSENKDFAYEKYVDSMKEFMKNILK